MNFKELHHLVKGGVHPVITCQLRIEDLENYAEPGMRARIVGSRLQNEEVLVLTLDFSEFDEVNKAFESANYYDKDGAAVLTAREANKYSTRQDYYVAPAEDMEGYMTITEGDALSLLNDYKESGFKGPYVQWLEVQLAALTKNLQAMREMF